MSTRFSSRLSDGRSTFLPLIVSIVVLAAAIWQLPTNDEADHSVLDRAAADVQDAGEERTATVTGDTGNATGVATSGGEVPGASVEGTSTDPLDRAGAPGVRFSAGCDLALGRIKVPAVSAPPCMPLSAATARGGNDHRGVTKETIKIAIYIPAFNASTLAIATAAGAGDNVDPEKLKPAYADYIKYFEHHYEQYGRKVEFVFVDASGDNQDDTAAKADAIRVAEEIGAFASIGGPGGALAYAKELAARKVLCIQCFAGLPRHFLTARAPYLWDGGAGWSTGGAHVAELIGKRLWNKKAKWAGSAELRSKTRKFATVLYDTPEQDYRSGVEEFEEMLKPYGASMADRISYTLDVSRAQEQARVVVARLKAKEITTVFLATDWVFPIFLTVEATRQNYRPEWLAAGGAAANFAARQYDQSQWSHAFGPNSARVNPDLQEFQRVYTWHYGHPPEVECCYGPLWMFFTGVHLAGAKLTPETFRDGLFAFPPSGGSARGGRATTQISFGKHGFVPWTDYNGGDDLAEAWWDPEAEGIDELGKSGNGMYRAVAGGKRYRPGGWPRGDPSYFNPAGTVVQFDELPPEDRPPSYPRPS